MKPCFIFRFQFTERFILETLRLFPSIPIVGRHVPEDMELLGYEVPAGTDVVFNIFALLRDPKYWPDPLAFDPDRFLPHRSEGRHPHCYLPFLAGPRDCIGKKYAMMQATTALVTVVRALHVLPAQDGISHPSQVPLAWRIALAPAGGTKVRFTPRVASASQPATDP